MLCLKRAVSAAVVLALFAGISHAQGGPFYERPTSGSAPEWKEFHSLSARLEALESENRSLRSEIAQPSRSDSVVTQADFGHSCCEPGVACESPATDCSWIDQLSQECKDRLSWNKGPIRVVPFGYAAADMIASERAYTLLGGPLFLLPAVPAGIPDSRFTISGQQTTLGFNITGPDLRAFRSSSTVAFNFFGDRPVQNNPGVFFLLGYVELRNEQWRFWAGQDADAIGRQNSNSPSWTSHKQSGNAGQIRPGFRMERYFTLSDNARSSVYLGLTQQVVLDFIANPQVAGTDNGWPNVEGRWELALGPAGDAERSIVLAVGGLIGETRAVDFTGRPVANVSKTWAVIPELRVQLGCFGFQGEVFVGEAIGTYNAGIGQSLNALTNQAIYTTGGFGELFCILNSYLTVAVGYGVDDPRDSDLSLIQRSLNETYWANAICRWNEQWETRCEVSRQKTDYLAPNSDSNSMLYQLSVRFNF